MAMIPDKANRMWTGLTCSLTVKCGGNDHANDQNEYVYVYVRTRLVRLWMWVCVARDTPL
jgi:hypothetical protein